MADKDAVWERLRARHELTLPLADVVRWDFADFVFGLEHDLFASTMRLRRAGFAGCLETPPHLLAQVEAYRAARVLP
jgi:hypothetical protein